MYSPTSHARGVCVIPPTTWSWLQVAILQMTGSPTTGAPTEIPTPAPTGAPTEIPTPAPTTAYPSATPTVGGVAHSGDIRIVDTNDDPLELSTGTYPVTTSVSGDVNVGNNPGLRTLGNAFPRLTRVDGVVTFWGNDNLATLGTAFPVLVELGTSANNNYGRSLVLANNPTLRTLGSAFASLRRISGTVYFNNNPLLTNFEALRNVECHGGMAVDQGWGNPSVYCQGCPAWFLAKPQC